MLNVFNIKVFKNRFYSVGLVFTPIVFLSWVKGKDSYMLVILRLQPIFVTFPKVVHLKHSYFVNCTHT